MWGQYTHTYIGGGRASGTPAGGAWAQSPVERALAAQAHAAGRHRDEQEAELRKLSRAQPAKTVRNNSTSDITKADVSAGGRARAA